MDLLGKLRKYLAKDFENAIKVQSHFKMKSSGTLLHWLKKKEIPEKHQKDLEKFLKGKV